jgi:hypothetical protein
MLGIAGPAGAITLDDEGRYQLGGYLENITAMRLEDGIADPANPGEYLQEEGDLAMMRNILFLDFNAELTDELSFKFIGRGYYEALWDIDDSVYQPPKEDYSKPGRYDHDMRIDFEFREYYATYRPGNFTIKAGRMQVAWGEADAIRIADIINPLDLSWYWSFPKWEDIRIPLHMVDVAYAVPNSAHNLRIEAVWVPDFMSHMYAAPGANWDFLGLIGVDPTTAGTIYRQQAADLPDRGFGEFQGGVRVKATLWDWDWTVFGYYGRDHLGVNTLDLSGNAQNPAYPVKYHYPAAFNLGGTFAGYCSPLDMVLRGEFAYTFDQPFQKFNSTPIFPGGPRWGDFGIGQTDYAEKDTLAVMLGFDKNIMLPSINRTKSFYISGQLFWKTVFGYDGDDNEELVTFWGDEDRGENWYVASLLINTEFYEGKIVPQVLGVHFLDSECGFFDGNLTYKPTYTLSFTLGYLGIWGNENNAGLYFGPVQKNDQVYLRAKWTF